MTYPHNPTVSVSRSVAREWMRRVLDLLFPPHCVACAHMGAWFCAECVASVQPVPQPICTLCGTHVPRAGLCARCRATPPPLDGIRSVALFQGGLRTAIHEFKYQRRRVLAPILGEMMSAYWAGCGVPIDVIVPVPLHGARKKERGFNQAHLLALELAGRCQLRLDDSHLLRTRSTVPQVGLAVAQRKTNVANAFAWRGAGLHGRCILLIDDVCTTGATLGACATVLRSAGADSIWALTLARPMDGD